MDGVVAVRNLIIHSCLLSAYYISYQFRPQNSLNLFKTKQLSTNLDYVMRIVEQTGPIPSLCYNGGKENYQIIRNAMQIIKIESCAKDGL